MLDTLWIPITLAIVGIGLSYLTSKRGITRHSEASTEHGAVAFEPKPMDDVVARRMLPFLKMHNGSYPLGDVELRLHGSGC